MSINSGPHCPGSTPAATCNGRVTLNDLHSIRPGVPHLENEGEGTASTANGFLRVHPSKSPMNARKGEFKSGGKRAVVRSRWMGHVGAEEAKLDRIPT